MMKNDTDCIHRIEKQDAEGNVKETYSIDYTKLSEKIISQLTDIYMDAANAGCSAIINVGVYNPITSSTSKTSKKDERKIIAYNIRNIDEDDLPQEYFNPVAIPKY